MNLKEFKTHIDRLIEMGYGDAVVVSASDDEGNEFSEVIYIPTIGWFKHPTGKPDYEIGYFIGANDDLPEDKRVEMSITTKAVCIN